MASRIAVITGANRERGLGFATAIALAERGLRVIATGRDRAQVEALLAPARARGLDLVAEQLDVGDDASVEGLFARLDREHAGRIDVLVNNAGGIFPGGDTLHVASSTMLAAFDTNALGPLRMAQRAVPRMLAANYGRIVNVGTGMAGLGEMNGGSPAYRVSKTALNAVTRVVHAELRGDVKINSVCPGWVQTDMGGRNATRTIAEGIEGIVWAATLPSEGPSGGFFRDGERIAW